MKNGKLFTHKLYQIRERGEGKKASWTEVGVGFSNKDGSINLIFNAIPVNGKVQLREYTPKESKE